MTRRSKLLVAGVAGGLLLIGAGAAAVVGPVSEAERSSFDPDRGRDLLDDEDADEAAGDDAPAVTVESVEPPEGGPSPAEDVAYESVLVLGSDAGLEEGDERADAIAVGLLLEEGEPVLFSLPRDLWVDNPCEGHRTRLNAGLYGCGSDASGIELTAAMVEQVTQLTIDHVVEMDFEGFETVVDEFGGVEVCTDNPVRDPKVDEDWGLPGGCVDADGEQALGWVRSRGTLEEVDGTWRYKDGVDDLTRIERQQELMLELVSSVGDVGSAYELRGRLDTLLDQMRLSDTLDLVRITDLAWSARGLEPDDIRRVSFDVHDHQTEAGAEVLLLDEPVPDVLVRELEDGQRLLDAR